MRGVGGGIVVCQSPVFHVLIWVATCLDTFAPLYRMHATSEPGKVAEVAEEQKAENNSTSLQDTSLQWRP